MRLLNAKTYQLEEYFDDDIPRYAILSHTWDKDEALFQDMKQSGTRKRLEAKRGGLVKVDGCARQALRNGLEYIWIDTCCIDKSSSAELNEAINSMFRWYKTSEVCYVYLADVPSGTNMKEETTAFSRSRWLTRGWTLQELLAPQVVEFYDASWNRIGSKSNNLGLLQVITGIDRKYLINIDEIYEASVAERMSWASQRKTTRKEDLAYCLLGIFNINMPLLYGEGERAFTRLQEEILKESEDHSIFAWGFRLPLESVCRGGVFAKSPNDFGKCGDIISLIPETLPSSSHYFMTNKGLQIRLPLLRDNSGSSTTFAILNCSPNPRPRQWRDACILAVPLAEMSPGIYERPALSAPILISQNFILQASPQTLYLLKHSSKKLLGTHSITILEDFRMSFGLFLTEVYPPHAIYDIDRVRVGCTHTPRTLFRFSSHGRRALVMLVDAAFEIVNFTRTTSKLACRFARIGRKTSLLDIITDRGLSHIHEALQWSEIFDFENVDKKVQWTVVVKSETIPIANDNTSDLEA